LYPSSSRIPCKRWRMAREDARPTRNILKLPDSEPAPASLVWPAGRTLTLSAPPRPLTPSPSPEGERSA
jgi:hypothetical protein